MVSSDSPLVEVQENKTKTGVPRKCALSSFIVDPDAVGSPENEYVPCSNQNGAVQSPVWTFFRLRKSDLEKAQPGLRQCYCKVVGCGAVRNRSASGSTKAFSVYFEDDHRWPNYFCNAVVADARAQGKIIQPRNHSDLISQKSGVKRKQCAEAAHAIREVKAAKVLRDLTSEAGVVEHDGDEVFMVPLSPDEQTRLDQKFVRKVVIGDLKCCTFAGWQRF